MYLHMDFEITSLSDVTAVGARENLTNLSIEVSRPICDFASCQVRVFQHIGTEEHCSIVTTV